MILFQEGDNGNFFYIVKKGEFSLSIKDREETKKIFKNGDTFGELSLIQKNKRSGTVTCKEDGMVYFLEGSIFREIVQKINKQFLKERIYFLSLIPLFSIII
jgi:CRP-like cAMP-binding protein